MTRVGFFLFMIFLLAPAPASAELYQYTDREGVVSYTDRIEAIPESSRAAAKMIDESALPPLQTLPRETGSPEPRDADGPTPGKRRPVRGLIALGILAGLSWLAVRAGGGNILMKIAGRMMITAALGAGVYLIFTAQPFRPPPPSTADPAAAPVFERVSPIAQARETAQDFRKQITEQEEELDRAAPDPRAARSPFHPPAFSP